MAMMETSIRLSGLRTKARGAPEAPEADIATEVMEAPEAPEVNIATETTVLMTASLTSNNVTNLPI